METARLASGILDAVRRLRTGANHSRGLFAGPHFGPEDQRLRPDWIHSRIVFLSLQPGLLLHRTDVQHSRNRLFAYWTFAN